MPQDGSGNYQYPLGTRGVPDETIESAAYNNFLDDLVGNDLNIPRPIHRGGTGATTADAALANLGAEKAAQLVTNYDTHVWLPGSFRSAGTATAGPVDGHAFAGIVYINEPLVSPPTNANVTVSARDMNDTVVPSRVYVREKKAGVWSAWTGIDATTLPFPPGGGFTATTILGAIQELDTEKVAKAGDTMTGALTISQTNPAFVLKKGASGENAGVYGFTGANPRWGIFPGSGTPESGANVGSDFILTAYADNGAQLYNPLVALRSDGLVRVLGDPTAALGIATKQYVDASIAAIATVLPLSTPLRFTRASSQHMARTFGITSSQPWTLSMWVKRNTLGTHQALFGISIVGNALHVGFNSLDQIGWFGGTGGNTQLGMSTMTFTDTNQWLNIIWSCPTASTTPAVKTWLLDVNNGLLPQPFTMVGTDQGLNSGIAHYIGAIHYPDLLMKEVIFVDGAALTPSSFGVNVGGVWTPITYSGAYGTNGFKLSFSNPLPPTNLGIDSSGNGNHWTPVNF